jgi:outer membrane lipoprotein-sorting protein
MYKRRAFAILCWPVLAALPLAAQEADLTLDQIVQKHIEALGGLEKLKALQTLKATGKALLNDGQFEAPVAMWAQRPALTRIEINFKGKSFVHAFDGTTAWTVNPFSGSEEAEKASPEETKMAQDDADFVDGPLVNYQAKGNTVELVGKEDVAGSPAYKLKVTKKGGFSEYDYLDAKTFLAVKSAGKRTQDGKEYDFESYPGDYRPVNGVLIPFTTEQKLAGRTTMKLTLVTVEGNVPIDDAVFHFPEPKPDIKHDDGY